MFFFKKKSPKLTDLSWLKTDIHSHLIPGIDDGSPDMATSLALIKDLAALGYKKIITTPHINWEVYPNTPEIITAGLGELQEAVAAEGIDVEIGAAAEYYIDEHFGELLRQKAPLLTLKDNLLLVEFSFMSAPLDLQDVLFDLQMLNYQPVIAHPERYLYLERRRDFYEMLKHAGCYFQLNLLSLTGYYGRGVQELAAYLLKQGYYNFAGTDLHHDRHIAALKKLEASPLYGELKEAGLMNPGL
ncbi:histidinol phosphatase [Chitinophagaceae bacterium LB-8]|uniref:protein-tyrosine-phosphatase n=1 Tax=Paraflavisolibacter caeni TaxID=2982496 RepID=A0A9X2XY41_9BACT|nr:CpsB/CapC family capsule biosynthesis tyrosine phosphatase [Paraflavisolibacter caeni]MCU7551310.1 histidinol phosphatase [Paraflavisolibacter caeni]